MRWILPLLGAACATGITLADRTDAATVRTVLVWLTVHAAFGSACWPRAPLLWSTALLACAATGAIGVADLDRASRPAVERPGSGIAEARLGAASGAGLRARRTLHDVHWVAPLPWASWPARRLPERLDLDFEPGHPLAREAPGARIRVALRVRPNRSSRNPGGPEAGAAARRRGIGGRAVLVHPSLVWVSEPASGPRAALWRWRQRTAARLSAAGDGGALLAALALGWRRELPSAASEAFRSLGLSHLLAVSGLHLALVGGGVFGFARRGIGLALPGLADPRRIALGAALVAAAAYALLTGTPVSVRRAFLMLLVPTLAVSARRPVASPALFGAAAIGILWLDPVALFSPGAQLSFAATAGLVVALRGAPVGPEVDSRAPRLDPLRVALHASAAAVLATAPIVAAHFGTALGWGWLANVLAVPLTALVLLPGALAAVLMASIPCAGAAALVEVACLPAAWFLDAAIALAPLAPNAAGLTPAPAVLVLAAAVAVFVLRSGRLVPTVLGAFAVSGLLAWAPPAAWGPPPPRAVFFDVGQGDATVLQSRGAALLVDAGTRVPDGFDAGERIVVPALRALGIRRLDLAVASHRDLDHRGGLEAVLQQLPVDRLWIPAGSQDDPAFAALRALARRRGTRIEGVSAGRRDLVLPGFRIEVLWPPRRDPPRGNDGSIVLRVHAGPTRILLPGDLEASGEAALLATGVDLHAEVLKLPHHGSRSSTTPAFLGAVAPRLAVVSAARFSRWGMPHEEVTTRVEALGIHWRWPARDGAVAVPLSGPAHPRAPQSRSP